MTSERSHPAQPEQTRQHRNPGFLFCTPLYHTQNPKSPRFCLAPHGTKTRPKPAGFLFYPRIPNSTSQNQHPSQKSFPFLSRSPKGRFFGTQPEQTRQHRNPGFLICTPLYQTENRKSYRFFIAAVQTKTRCKPSGFLFLSKIRNLSKEKQHASEKSFPFFSRSAPKNLPLGEGGSAKPRRMRA